MIKDGMYKIAAIKKNIFGDVFFSKNPLTLVPANMPKLAKLVKIAYSVAATFFIVISIKRAQITEINPPMKSPYRIYIIGKDVNVENKNAKIADGTNAIKIDFTLPILSLSAPKRYAPIAFETPLNNEITPIVVAEIVRYIFM